MKKRKKTKRMFSGKGFKLSHKHVAAMVIKFLQRRNKSLVVASLSDC